MRLSLTVRRESQLLDVFCSPTNASDLTSGKQRLWWIERAEFRSYQESVLIAALLWINMVCLTRTLLPPSVICLFISSIIILTTLGMISPQLWILLIPVPLAFPNLFTDCQHIRTLLHRNPISRAKVHEARKGRFNLSFDNCTYEGSFSVHNHLNCLRTVQSNVLSTIAVSKRIWRGDSHINRGSGVDNSDTAALMTDQFGKLMRFRKDRQRLRNASLFNKQIAIWSEFRHFPVRFRIDKLVSPFMDGKM